MQEKYNHKEIEQKWQKIWDDKKVSKIDKDDTKNKFYMLDMFPYPSGDGLHMGHTESYTASDVYYRFKKMQGHNVLHPQGFDAFGLPAENFAIKTGVHPAQTTEKNIATYIKQMKSLGLNYDFDEQAITSDPKYYKWTQWIFSQFYKNNLVYKRTQKANWCPSCQTVIANEQVVGGECERCGTQIVQKEIPGWFFKITDFADDLIDGLEKIDWPEHTKKNQRNWIGKSEGALIEFRIKNLESSIKVFTTRPDTLFGATYMVLAPEHPLITELSKKNLEVRIQNLEEVNDYIEKAKKKTEMERIENKEKTGVRLEGVFAVNPANKEEIPVFIADYVLGGYGTGAIMAVPAHDERDFEFAKKYNLSIKQVISGFSDLENIPDIIKEIGFDFDWQEEKVWRLKYPTEKISIEKLAWHFDTPFWNTKNGCYDLTPNEVMGDKIKNSDEYERTMNADLTHPVDIMENKGRWLILDGLHRLVKAKILGEKEVSVRIIPREEIKNISPELHSAFIGKGLLINSEQFNRMSSEEAKQKITEFVGGEMTSNYRLRDWSISRQRYWGCPIPIIYCRKCWENHKTQIPNSKQNTNSKFQTSIIDGKEYAVILVPESNLPIKLPTDVDFKPTGESPLKYSKSFNDISCPVCGSKEDVFPEYDTMDTFVDSSWYFLRYPDVHNDSDFCSEARKKWLPVDLYIGGAEHTYMHLLFARFFTKAMYKIGLLDFDEPFLKLRHQGMVLDAKGKKMSKSKGNVVNPDEMVERFGADSVRAYMLFAAPLEDEVIWNEDNIVGIYRFLEKVWRIRVNAELTRNYAEHTQKNSVKNILHKTIKKVTNDIENLRYNTAVSSMMILANEIEKIKEIEKEDYQAFLKLLSPFAPHITQELWEQLGNDSLIQNEKWPEYDENLTKDNTHTIALQVNGKVRSEIEIEDCLSEEEIKNLALQDEVVKKWVGENEPKKIIYVKNRLVNIVV